MIVGTKASGGELTTAHELLTDKLTIIAHFSLNDGMLGTASEVRLHDVDTFSVGGKQPETNTIS